MAAFGEHGNETSGSLKCWACQRYRIGSCECARAGRNMKWNCPRLSYKCGPGQFSLYFGCLRARRSEGRNAVEVEIFRNRPDRPWVPPSLLHNEYRVFPGGKAAGALRWPHTQSSAEVMERVELYLYFPSGPLWPVKGWTLVMNNTPLMYSVVSKVWWYQSRRVHCWHILRSKVSEDPLNSLSQTCIVFHQF